MQYAASTTCGDYDPASGAAVPFTNAMCGDGKEYNAAASSTSIASDGAAAAITKCCKVRHAWRMQSVQLRVCWQTEHDAVYAACLPLA